MQDNQQRTLQSVSGRDIFALRLLTGIFQGVALYFVEGEPTIEQARAAATEEGGGLVRAGGHQHPVETAHEVVQRVQEPHLSAGAPLTRAKARLMLALGSASPHWPPNMGALMTVTCNERQRSVYGSILG